MTTTTETDRPRWILRAELTRDEIAAKFARARPALSEVHRRREHGETKC